MCTANCILNLIAFENDPKLKNEAIIFINRLKKSLYLRRLIKIIAS